MKLAGAAKTMFLDMDPAEFERQIEDYEAPDEGTLKKLYKLQITLPETHPFPVLRAKRLSEWRTDFTRLCTAVAG